jgi:hypothetical protein
LFRDSRIRKFLKQRECRSAQSKPTPDEVCCRLENF